MEIAREVVADIGLPVVIRPAYILGGKGTGIAATDNATINDTNYPPASATLCKGWRSVLISARGVGGALTSVSVQALYRLGTEWVTGPTATVLGSDGASAAFDTMGHLCFFRVTALTLGGATTVTLNCTG